MGSRSQTIGRSACAVVLSFTLALGPTLEGAAAWADDPSSAETSGGGASQLDSAAEGGAGEPEDSQHVETVELPGASGQASAEAPLSQDPKPVAGEVRAEGLVYSLNADGESVSLVGWCGDAPSGDVVIPAAVSSGADSYAVASLENPSGDGLFAGTSVERLSIPASVASIADEALSGCPTLSAVSISSKNETFASFDGMLFSKDLSSLLLVPAGKEGAAQIPDPATSVPAGAFSRAPGLCEAVVGEGNASYSSRGGILFSKDMKTLVACPPGAGDAVVIPASVEAIADGAFAGCAVASITVLGDVREIADGAFEEAVRAEAVVALPGGEDYGARRAVWEAAGFARFAEPARPGDVSVPVAPGGEDVEGGEGGEQASGLAYEVLEDYTLAASWAGPEGPAGELAIPASAEVGGVSYRVSAIAPAGFAGCSGLTGISLPAGLTHVGERAFEACGLAELWLPASVAYVGPRALAACSSLERVIALGATDAAPDALAEDAGVSVYCPSGSEDSWNMGLPAAGNHLMPYGVSLSNEPLIIEVGESADLFDGGVCEIPHGCEMSYSYPAKPISVESNLVTGKMIGISEISVVVMLDGIELTKAVRGVQVIAPKISPYIYDFSGTYTYRFDTQGGSPVPADQTQYLDGTSSSSGVSVKPNATRPANPSRAGYSFLGWYLASSPDSFYDFGSEYAKFRGSDISGGANGVITFYAKWSPYNYSFTLGSSSNVNTSGSSSSGNYATGSTITLRASASTGYHFVKWISSNSSLVSDLYSANTTFSMPAGPVTMTPSVALTSYSISYELNGGSQAANPPTSYTMQSSDVALPTPTRIGYDFSGWYESSGFSGSQVTSIPKGSIGDRKYYARWSPKTYAVTFDSQGGSAVSDVKATYGSVFSKPTDPSRLGYAFAGWFKDSACTSTWDFSKDVMPLNGVTLYAKWMPNTFTVVYDGNGNTSGSTGQTQFTYDVSSILAQSGFVKTGYSFVGWNTLSNGTGQSYAAGSSQKNLATTGTFKLYAQWKANTYKVRFNPSGGTGTMPDQTFTYDAASTALTKNAFVKTGYIFAGWTATPGGTVQYSDFAAVQNLTAVADGLFDLYAVWRADSYNVTFDSQGGDAVSSQKVEYGNKVAKPSPDPRKPGYSFEGWYEEAACTNAWNFAEMAVSGKLTLYAKWMANTYTVIFDENSGTGVMEDQAFTYDVLQTLKSNSFERTGYSFAGWNTKSDGTGAAYADGESVSKLAESGSVKLFAQWKPNSYVVRFDGNGSTSGSMSDLAMTYGSAKPLTANGFSKIGYDFAGWATSSTGDVMYENGASVNNLTTAPNGTLKLYAVWIPATFTLSFDSQGGSLVEDASVVYGTKPSAPTDPSKSGYYFAGWYKDASCEQAWRFEEDTMPAENVVLHAKWILAIVCIAPASASVTIDATGKVTSSTPQAFTSSAVEPIKVTAISSSELAGAAQIIPDAATRRDTRVTVVPTGGSAASLGLNGSVQEESLASFTIPQEGSLPISFGLDLPDGARLNYQSEGLAVADLMYTVSAF